MKALILIILAAAFCTSAHSQRIRMTDSTNVWRVYCDGGGTDYYSVEYDYTFKGDTVINGLTYHRLAGTTIVFQSTPSSTATIPKAGTYFLREDTIAHKVWCRKNRTYLPVIDTGEQLIYNVAWAVNDTIQSATGSGAKWSIGGVDSTQISGQWYKIFRVELTTVHFHTDYFDIVEGIGATAGPGYIFTGASGNEYNIQLRCFYNKGVKPSLNPPLASAPDMFSNAGPCTLAITAPASGSKPLLYPVPVTKASKIQLPQSVSAGRLIICNSLGKIVSDVTFSNTASVALPPSCASAGIYYYRLSSMSENPFTGSFVIQ